jgi:hypothetical protein
VKFVHAVGVSAPLIDLGAKLKEFFLADPGVSQVDFGLRFGEISEAVDGLAI